VDLERERRDFLRGWIARVANNVARVLASGNAQGEMDASFHAYRVGDNRRCILGFEPDGAPTDEVKSGCFLLLIE
jgi:hypothetical protein